MIFAPTTTTEFVGHHLSRKLPPCAIEFRDTADGQARRMLIHKGDKPIVASRTPRGAD